MGNLKPADKPRLLAFVDESGHSARTDSASKHFVLAAVAFFEQDADQAAELVETLKRDIGQDRLHWQNAKDHSKRLHMAELLGAAEWLTITSVVTCKNRLDKSEIDSVMAYNYAARFLLERLSWLAEQREATLDCRLSHVKGGGRREQRMREYLERLKTKTESCRIDWDSVHNIDIVAPDSDARLDLADIAASGFGKAFEVDEFDNYEDRYLWLMRERLYRTKSNLFSYGLKLYPKLDNAESHRWLPKLAEDLGVDPPEYQDH